MKHVEFAAETLHRHTIPAAVLLAHYEEIAPMKDRLKLNPDWDHYLAAQERGELLFVTARDTESKNLVGYMVVFLNRHPHYRDAIVAVDDLHYLRPEYRGQGAGKTMIGVAELFAKNRGAIIFSMRCKAAQDHGHIFKALGYELTDLVYIKEL